MIGWLRTITRRPFVVDALYLQSGQAATIALQAATSLILLRILGPELAGVYAIGTALAAAIALLDLTGANRLALVDVARAHGMRDADAIRGILARFIRVSVLVRLPMVPLSAPT
jgi:O-antigen/teichoic acid export membrane protein